MDITTKFDINDEVFVVRRDDPGRDCEYGYHVFGPHKVGSIEIQGSGRAIYYRLQKGCGCFPESQLFANKSAAQHVANLRTRGARMR